MWELAKLAAVGPIELDLASRIGTPTKIGATSRNQVKRSRGEIPEKISAAASNASKTKGWRRRLESKI